MIAEDWTIISGLIDEWWPGKFDASAGAAWYVALEGFDASDVIAALKGRLARGGTFRPSVAEVVGEIRRDPSEPTFDEALTLIRSAFKAGRRPLRGDFSGEAQMIGAREEAVRASARELHPLVAAFVARCSDLSRLEDEIGEMAGGEYAGARRRELEQRWEAHVEALEGRDIASIAAGRRRGSLGRLDPLAALSIRAGAGELAAASEAA